MQYTQEEVERELSDAVPFGLRKVIAAGTGIYAKIVEAFFNPNDERKSPHFTVLHIQAVLDKRDPAAGEALWQKMNALRQGSMPRRFSPKTPTDTLTAKLNNENRTTVEWIEAIRDGRIDRHEAISLRSRIRNEQNDLIELESLVNEMERAN